MRASIRLNGRHTRRIPVAMAAEHLCGLDSMDSSPSMTMKLSASVSCEGPLSKSASSKGANSCVFNLKWDTNVEDCPYYTRCTLLVRTINSTVDNKQIYRPSFLKHYSMHCFLPICQSRRITVPFGFFYCHQPRQPAARRLWNLKANTSAA